MSCLVGLLACGSMCGPCLPGFPVALLGALSAYSRGGGFGVGPPTWIGPHRIPVSSPCALRVSGNHASPYLRQRIQYRQAILLQSGWFRPVLWFAIVIKSRKNGRYLVDNLTR